MSARIARKIIYNIIFFVFAIAFLVKIFGAEFLKMYIQHGVGSCEKVPILCMTPHEIIPPQRDAAFSAELIPYKFPGIEISAPRGFNVVKERTTKVFYKKHKQLYKGDVIYLTIQEPNYFVTLYPQLKENGVLDDYEFVRRIFYANLNRVKTVVDAFFVIFKGIFSPDLGGEGVIQTTQFKGAGYRAFFNYSLHPTGNYFDCNLVYDNFRYCKVYIKDKSARLDPEKVITILESIKIPRSP